MKLSDLLEWKRSGIYCLVNEEDKYVQVFGTRNVLEHVSNLLKKVHTGEYGVLKDHLNRISINILEWTDDEQSLKVLQSSWTDKYRNNGYILYRSTNLVSYAIKDNFGQINRKMYYLVYLENRRKEKIIVGVFDSKDEAISWKSLQYPNDIIDNLVFCQNEYLHLIK